MNRLIAFLVLLVVIYGGYYYFNHKAATDQAIKDTSTTIVDTTAAGADGVITGALGSVHKISLYYYVKNSNYGVSLTKNICNDTSSGTSIGALINDIQKYTKTISCAVDTHFPSKSFTITAPSFVNAGQLFCTDQNGGVEMIPDTADGSGFVGGVGCKE